MTKQNKNIILVVILVLIAGFIWYLEAKKPSSVSVTPGSADIILPDSTGSGSASITDATSSGPEVATTSTKQLSDRTRIRAVKAKDYPRAKEFVQPSGFINTGPFKLSSVVGNKVVLIDFWTYSCINCERTIPYLNAWYQKYKNLGFTIVGVHTPEFDFEKVHDNVAKAVQQYGVQYPVVQDNDRGTWNAYENNYWPREYLIDIDGFIVHDKIGEGDYADTEKAIQKALQERSDALGLNLKIPTDIASPIAAISMDESQIASKETYFGSARNQYLGNGSQGVAGSQTLSTPSSISPNTLYLDGTWNFQDQYAENTSPTAKIIYKYQAKNVYFVASSKNGVKAKILIDGAPIGALHGSDVASDGTVTIKDNRLYDLVKGSDYGTHTLEIDIEGSGLDAYTFTFG